MGRRYVVPALFRSWKQPIMSQEDKNTKPTQADGPATQSAEHNPARSDPQKDPDQYDPVGMAGKPAGILLELGEEASEEAKAKVDPSKDEAGRAAPDRKD